MPLTKNTPLLQVKHLSIGFDHTTPFVPPLTAVDDVSFSLQAGEALCLVGESGCGKSVTAKGIIRLLQTPPARYLGGDILFDGQPLLPLAEKEMLHIRGNRMGMIFQEPMTSLNPVIRIGQQVAEPLILHRGHNETTVKANVINMLHAVGLPNPEYCYTQYPHELSGGMRQRIMIAMALICSPALVLADEPTTALDVTIQQQILTLLRQLIKQQNTALLLITHDFTVVSRIADHVAVMYAGQLVEKAPVNDILENPQHPYTKGLLASRPALHTAKATTLQNEKAKSITAKRRHLAAIPGTVPPLEERPKGCLFHPRCPQAMTRCQTERPPLLPLSSESNTPRYTACWLLHK